MKHNPASTISRRLGARSTPRSIRTLLAAVGVLTGLLSAGTTARGQLASETTLYSFSQRLGFFGPLDYPPLFQAPGISNDGLAIYGLLPVTGDGDGGSGVFVYTSKDGKVSTVYTDGNPDILDVFAGYGGTSAYAVTGQNLISLPGGGVISPNGLDPIIQGNDGIFYGFAGDSFLRITAGGAAVIASVDTGSIQMIQASDGNFYVIGEAGIAQILASDSTVTTLYSFAEETTEPAGIIEATGSNGTLFYGFRAAGTGDPNYSGYGIIYRLNINAGGSTTFSVLHDLAADYSEGVRPNSMLLGTDGNLYGTTSADGPNGGGTFFRVTPGGEFTVLYAFGENPGGPVSVAQLSDGNFYVVCQYGGAAGGETIAELQVHPAFFAGEVALDNGVYYLSFPDGGYFGYYSYLSDSHYIYHFDLGYEYLFDAKDGKGGLYLYDFASDTFFYTSLEYPFPYLYDFTLKTVLYYYPDTTSPGHYTSNPRYFYDFATGKIITK